MKAEEMGNVSCDLETGLCSPQEDNGAEEIWIQEPPKVSVIYYTDPICSACWALEPSIRKLQEEYGSQFKLEYRMGGLLPGWQAFSDAGNGISKPSDVAGHWEEIARHFNMSMDGDVWLEDPLDSSYPPSIAYKAAQLQGEKRAEAYLRRIREMVFLEKTNIAKEEHLLAAAGEVGLDTGLFLADFHSEAARIAFDKDMEDGRSYNVRGFPTLIFVGPAGKGYAQSGIRPYEQYVQLLEKAAGHSLERQPVELGVEQTMQKYGFLGTEEVRVLLDLDQAGALSQLAALEAAGKLKRVPVKFGEFWRWNKVS
ncbi:DsbA family protein [Paenibacillus donghaensis]|nr:DsbA family protein [Paenibacillus donghaensis]